MQIVYLSARPALFAETLDHLKHFAPFIDTVVVVAPERMGREFLDIEGVDTVLTDEGITGLSGDELDALPHTSRNYLLRTSAVRHGALAGTFVMSDDDSRPLVPIDESYFVTGDGKHRRRWFHSMASWRKSATDFDESILHTWVILRQRGFPDPLSYAGHMPQIIDKDLYAAVADELATQAEIYPLEEWSPYFTIGARLQPDRFAEPEPFETLGWPRYPGEWSHQLVPPKLSWENHHPELHDDGGLYDGIPTGCDPATIDASNLEKIIRWYRLEVQVRELAFPNDVEQPWTGPSSRRKLAFRGLKAARSAYRYVAIDERARITELEGRLQRLEQERRPDA